MANKTAILVDMDLCIGCYTCVVACHQWHQVPDGEERIKINTIGPETVNGKLKMQFFPQRTESCTLGKGETKPFCVDFCPVEALTHCEGAELVDLLTTEKRYQICIMV